MEHPARPYRAELHHARLGIALALLLFVFAQSTPTRAGTVEVHDPSLYTAWADLDIGAATAGFCIVDGELHILNGQSGQVAVYDLHGRRTRTWETGLTGYGDRGLSLLAQHRFARRSMSVLGEEVLVADPDQGRVLRPQRGPQFAFTGDRDGLVTFQRPVAVVQGRVSLRVLDAGLGQVVTLFPDLSLAAVWPACGSEGAGVDPIAISEDEDGRFFVADRGTGRIHGFNANGSPLWSIGGTGTAPGLFARLTGLQAMGGGFVAVDGGADRAQFFNFQGELLLNWGDAGDPELQLDGPIAVSVSPNNAIYVADAGHHRIVAFDVRTPAEPFQVQITNAPATTTGVEPLLVLFKADATGGWQPYQFEWDFGDGSPRAGGATVQHRFQSAGTYPVTLYATDSGDPVRQAQGDRNVTVRLPDGNPPRLVLHIQPAEGVTEPCAPPTLGTLAQAVVTADLSAAAAGDYYIYLLVDRNEVPNVAGLQCGLTYGNGSASARNDGVGIDILEWRLCADLEFPMPGVNPWPNAGSGTLITWDSTTRCQTGAVAVAGYFVAQAHSQDLLRVLPRPADALASVADCENREYYLGANQLGVVAFSPGATLLGYNPVLGGGPGHSTPVRVTTWSSIKGLYSPR